jgi:hypothetical protein
MFSSFWESMKVIHDFVNGVEEGVNQATDNAPTDLRYMPHTEAEMQDLAYYQQLAQDEDGR